MSLTICDLKWQKENKGILLEIISDKEHCNKKKVVIRSFVVTIMREIFYLPHKLISLFFLYRFRLFLLLKEKWWDERMIYCVYKFYTKKEHYNNSWRNSKIKRDLCAGSIVTHEIVIYSRTFCFSRFIYSFY